MLPRASASHEAEPAPQTDSNVNGKNQGSEVDVRQSWRMARKRKRKRSAQCGGGCDAGESSGDETSGQLQARWPDAPQRPPEHPYDQRETSRKEEARQCENRDIDVDRA